VAALRRNSNINQCDTNQNVTTRRFGQDNPTKIGPFRMKTLPGIQPKRPKEMNGGRPDNAEA